MSVLYDPLFASARAGDMAGVRAALAAGFTRKIDNAFYIAAREGHLDIVQAMLAIGADVEHEQGAALRWAAHFGHLAVVAALLAAGAFVQVANNKALYAAATNRHLPVVALLLRAGACVPDELPHGEQIAACVSGALAGLSAVSLARQGFCPQALCVLLEQDGRAELAAILSAAQMLDTLTPEARADFLEELLAQHIQPESQHGNT